MSQEVSDKGQEFKITLPSNTVARLNQLVKDPTLKQQFILDAIEWRLAMAAQSLADANELDLDFPDDSDHSDQVTDEDLTDWLDDVREEIGNSSPIESLLDHTTRKSQ